jgi:hypothetical protein
MTERLKSRFRRADILKHLLKPYGLNIHYGGPLPGIQISNQFGSEIIAMTVTLGLSRAIISFAEKCDGEMELLKNGTSLLLHPKIWIPIAFPYSGVRMSYRALFISEEPGLALTNMTTLISIGSQVKGHFFG